MIPKTKHGTPTDTMKTHIISHPDNKNKRYEFTPVVSPVTRIRIRSFGFAGEERLDSLMQISVARAFWKDKVSQGWLVTKTDIPKPSVSDDIKKKEKEWLDKFIDQHLKSSAEKDHCKTIGTQLNDAIQKKKSIYEESSIEKEIYSLYMKNKKKHDKDFYKYDNYALEA